MHGFIAEVAECGIGNARSQIEGNAPVYKWINDNGPEDLRRGAVLIQQKFVQSGNHLSLQAIQQHLQTYPDFLKNGGVYQIPADHYEKIQWLLSISEKEANKIKTNVAKTTGGSVGREVGKVVGEAVFGKKGKTIFGNIGSTIGRNIMGTLMKGK